MDCLATKVRNEYWDLTCRIMFDHGNLGSMQTIFTKGMVENQQTKPVRIMYDNVCQDSCLNFTSPGSSTYKLSTMAGSTCHPGAQIL